MNSVCRARPSGCRLRWPGCGSSRTAAICRNGYRSSAPLAWIPTTCSYSPHSPSIATSISGWHTLPHPLGGVQAATDRNGLGASQVLRRANDSTEALVRHRLLAYLGRDVRELQLALGSINPHATDLHHGAREPSQQTLLGWLQSDIAANCPIRPLDERPRLDCSDRSVQFHACHGPDRQVEVLREVLVGLLADDATLEPRDIVVMCPDIENFAPLIAASFGLDTPETQAEHPGHRLRVRLADRSLRQLNPLLALVSRLVALADSRVEVSALLDLCAARLWPGSSTSARTTWSGCTTWCRVPGFVGASTPPIAAGSRWVSFGRTRGPPGWSGCCSA